MKRLAMSLAGALFVLLACQAFVFAQTTGSVTGAVVDANGAAVPNATVVIKGAGGQEFTVVTNDNGIYRVPSVASGMYSVTTTAPNFKRSVVEDVKVDVYGQRSLVWLISPCVRRFLYLTHNEPNYRNDRFPGREGALHGAR